MKELIKAIRLKLGLTQQEMAQLLCVSFATVNRWENGRALPNDSVQAVLYKLCKDKEISVYDIALARIKNLAAQYTCAGKTILYHGSKAGLHGPIAPLSRDVCDFGKGFYMGTIPEQPLTLIADYPKAKFYLVSLADKGLKTLAVQADLDWAMIVALNRKKLTQEVNAKLFQKYTAMLAGYDVIVGYIADDKMFDVLDDFFLGNITDDTLISCLSVLKLGQQYVAVSPRACAQVRIEQEIELSFLERLALQEQAKDSRLLGKAMAKVIYKNNRRKGRYYDEIV